MAKAKGTTPREKKEVIRFLSSRGVETYRVPITECSGRRCDQHVPVVATVRKNQKVRHR